MSFCYVSGNLKLRDRNIRDHHPVVITNHWREISMFDDFTGGDSDALFLVAI